jgi:hypothetical protein
MPQHRDLHVLRIGCRAETDQTRTRRMTRNPNVRATTKIILSARPSHQLTGPTLKLHPTGIASVAGIVVGVASASRSRGAMA